MCFITSYVNPLFRFLRLHKEEDGTTSYPPIKGTFVRYVRTRVICSFFAIALFALFSLVGPVRNLLINFEKASQSSSFDKKLVPISMLHLVAFRLS